MLDDVSVLHRVYDHGMLKQPIEKFATVSRCPTVEAKRKFIKIVIQMLRTNGALMSAEYPPFQKGHNTVYTRQKLRSGSTGTLDYSDFMNIAFCFQAAITFPSIGKNIAARFNGLRDERMKAFSGGVRDSVHTNSSNRFPFLFRGHYNQGFFEGLSPSNAFFNASQVSFVNLDSSGQSISPRPDHSSSDFMKPSPRRFIATKPEDTLEPESTCPILLGNNPPMALNQTTRGCRVPSKMVPAITDVWYPQSEH